MSETVEIFIAGVITGIAGNLIVSLFNHLLELRREKIKLKKWMEAQKTGSAIQIPKGDITYWSDYRRGSGRMESPYGDNETRPIYRTTQEETYKTLIRYSAIFGLILLAVIGLIVLWLNFPNMCFGLIGVMVGVAIISGFRQKKDK